MALRRSQKEMREKKISVGVISKRSGLTSKTIFKVADVANENSEKRYRKLRILVGWLVGLNVISQTSNF